MLGSDMWASFPGLAEENYLTTGEQCIRHVGGRRHVPWGQYRGCRGQRLGPAAARLDVKRGISGEERGYVGGCWRIARIARDSCLDRVSVRVQNSSG